MFPLRCTAAGVLFLIAILFLPAVAAESADALKEQVQALHDSIIEASKLYKNRQFDESFSIIRDVHQKANALAEKNSPELKKPLHSVYKSVRRARALLGRKGYHLSPINSSREGTSSSDESTVKSTPSIETSSISFSVDLLPVLVESCNRCHGSDDPPNEFSFRSFASLVVGGEGGPPLGEGNSTDSLLINKLKGTAPGGRMPANRPALSDAVISKFEKWIDQGAKFDGPDDRLPLEQLADIILMRRSSATEVSAKRVEMALRNWELGLPGVAADNVETKHFYLVGNVGEEALAEIGNLAETLWKKNAAFCHVSKGPPPIKGRVTIFVIQRRYDYSEFGKMVEERDVPRDEQGHWKYAIVDTYAAIMTGNGKPHEAKSLLGQQLAGIYVAGLGDVPEWFSEGTARVMVSFLDGRDSHVREWNAALADVVGSMSKPDDFLKGRMSPTDSQLVSYGFIQYLRKNRRHYRRLLGAVREGKDFHKSFGIIYGGSPNQIAAAWVPWVVQSQ